MRIILVFIKKRWKLGWMSSNIRRGKGWSEYGWRSGRVNDIRVERGYEEIIKQECWGFQIENIRYF